MTKKTFEQALAKLEQIVAELEQGDIALDSGLKKFDEGVQLAAFCSQKLHEARSRVDLLLGNDEAVPFNAAGEN